MSNIKKGDLVKITSRSSYRYEEKPLLIVLEKTKLGKHKIAPYIEFELFCIESKRIFYWPLKNNSYESLLKLDEYENHKESK